MAKKKMTIEEMKREVAKSIKNGSPSKKGVSMAEMMRQIEAAEQKKKTVKRKTK